VALAQGYPTKPIRMIVPFPPGGVNDNAARAIGQSLGPALGQAIVVENRAGANGNIGMDSCAKSAPDGHTICFPTGVILALNPFAYSKMPFEPMDLVPVIHVGTLDQALVVNAAVPVNNVRELVEYAKANPDKLSFASLGMGSTAHLYSEWFHAKTGARFIHVPYKGSPPLIQAVAAGEVNLSTNTPAVVLPFIKAGKLRLLGVVSEKGNRSPLFPDVPTLSEQGYELDFRNWLAIFFPPGTPGDIARRWNAEVNKLIADRAWVDRFITSQAVTATGGTPEFLVAFLKANRESAKELVKIAKLRFD
jgi:tripartite-type tricarboxylate transporter receptor subunit TctC